MKELTSAIEHSIAHNPVSYQGSRPELVALIPSASKVLDIGCNSGAVASAIKSKFPNCQIWGIELNSSALANARRFLEEGFCCDLDQIEEWSSKLTGLSFDVMIAADVLEHTSNPWKIVSTLYEHLSLGGKMYISLPNLAHWEIFIHLARLKWPVRERGIFDATHRRFFMMNDLQSLVPQGAEFRLLKRVYRLRESGGGRWDRALRLCVGFIPRVRDYFTFQYIFEIRKS